MLGMGVFNGENQENWELFCKDLKRGLCDMYGVCSMVVLSDREKGLISAVRRVFGESVPHSYCAWHMANNLSRHKVSRQWVYGIARAKTMDEVEPVFQEMGADRRARVESIGLEHFCGAVFPNPRYGFISSSVAECANNFLFNVRRKCGLDAVAEFVLSVNERLSSVRGVCARVQGDYPKWVRSKMDVWREMSYKQKIVLDGDSGGNVHVEDGDDHSRVFCVNLEMRTCTCGEFEDFQLPCEHAMHVIRVKGVNERQFIHPAYFVASTREITKTKLVVVFTLFCS